RGVFELVKALVRRPDQGLFGIAVVGENGHAEVQCQGHVQPERLDRRGIIRAHPAAQRSGLRGIGLRQEQSELIAADSKRIIRGAQRFAQRAGRKLQHVIALQVAVTVIDGLEAVQIHEHQGDMVVVALRAVQLLRKILLEQTAIVEAGERVRGRIDLELFQILVFHEDGKAQEIRGSQDVYQRGLQRNRLGERLRELAAAREDLVPELQAGGLAQLHLCHGLQEALQKLRANGALQVLQRLDQQIQESILCRELQASILRIVGNGGGSTHVKYPNSGRWGADGGGRSTLPSNRRPALPLNDGAS